VVLRTFSKAASLAGLRVGYAIADPDCIALLNRVRQPFNVNSLGQVAALAALQDEAHILECLRMIEAGRHYLYDELADYLYASLERRRREPLAARFVGASRAYRQWALDHPAEFGLLFGAPIPGVGHSPPAGSDAEGLRGHRFGQLWLELFVELSQTSAVPLVWRRPIPTSLRQQVERYLAALGDPVDVDTALMYLSCWERLYGSVCTEVFGHLSFALSDAEELFEDHLADVAVRLGLDHPDLGPDSARP